MSNKELMVTIRCITYNHKPYIRQCLEGFVMQKTNFRFEAIVHDDASTDGTTEILREYAEKYPDIIKPFYEEENQYSKHNGAIRRIMDENTHGKYAAQCEGDDYWTDPYKLQKQVDFLESHPDIAATAHQCEVIGDGSGMFLDNVPEFITMKDLISNSRLFHTASFVYRADKVLSLPRIDKPYISGDKLRFLRAAVFGPIKYFEEPMAVYRKHDSGMSSVVKIENLKKDKNIAYYMKSIYPKFPKYRYLSFLYGTFAMYPKDLGIMEKLWYLTVSFILSFSYFPENIKTLYKKLVNTSRISRR